MTHIDAEDMVERAAFLRDHGWQPDPREAQRWCHSRYGVDLPPLTMAEAVERERLRAIAWAERNGSPAGPSRRHA